MKVLNGGVPRADLSAEGPSRENLSLALAQFAPWKDVLKSSNVSQSYHCGAAGVQCMKVCHYRPQPKTVNILDFFKNAVQSFF